MELSEVLQYALGVGLAVIGWLARVIWAAVRELEETLGKLKEDLPIHYVRKDDFREFRHSVMDSLNRIENLLYQKADKV